MENPLPSNFMTGMLITLWWSMFPDTYPFFELNIALKILIGGISIFLWEVCPLIIIINKNISIRKIKE